MPNSLGTANGTLIAQRILSTLLEEFPFLSRITTDFSQDAVLFNQLIKVQLPSAMAASDYSTTDGYVAGAAAQTEVDLTVDCFKHVTYGFNDVERSSTAVPLIERFARNAAHALGLSMMTDLLELVTAAHFTNSTLLTPAAADIGSLVALNKKLNVRKLPRAGRFFLTNSDGYEYLSQDSRLVANPGSPSGTVRSGELGNVHGVATIEYPQLPANAEALWAIGGTPEALIIATRVPAIPTTPVPGSIENVTEPNTGLSLQMRSWYDMQKGQEFRSFVLMYGVAVGNAACLERFRSA